MIFVMCERLDMEFVASYCVFPSFCTQLVYSYRLVSRAVYPLAVPSLQNRLVFCEGRSLHAQRDAAW